MPDLFKPWPVDEGDSLPIERIIELYSTGHAGALPYPKDKQAELAELINSRKGGYADATDACHSYGLAESGQGQLVIPFQCIEKLYPGGLPGAGQDIGDCVSHGQKNANLLTMCCEIVAGKPDEVTGRIEVAPEVPPQGVQQGILSTEALYWYRRRAGRDGWFCGASAKVSITESATWVRKAYPELGVDLTKYSGRLATQYGRNPPTGEIAELGLKNLFRTATKCSKFEEIRDLLHNGYGINSCGGESFAEKRDSNGVAARTREGWAHAMAYIGVDDRPATHQKYGGPLVLVLNSWGPSWITGPRTILDTTVEIPNGSFWAKWSDLSRRECYAMSGHNGWPAQELPDWGWGGWT